MNERAQVHKEDPGNVLSESKPMRKFPGRTNDMKKNLSTTLISVLVVLAGVGTGYLLSGNANGKSTTTLELQTENVTRTQNEAGLADESNFSDSVEGVLVEGGIDGEGTHHLERPGGKSQNVYLTSTVIDLQSFVGKNVKVWGETLSAVKAGWLMDVGKVKVTN